MQSPDELDLYHLPWSEPAFAADPYPHFAAARARHPWLAKSDAGLVVFGLKAIRDLLSRDDSLRTAFDGIIEIMGAHNSTWGRFAQEQMLALPEREHKLLRDTFAARFTPRYANQLRPIMQEIIAGLLDEWLPRGQIDFEEFASYYPVAVTTRMIGAPPEAIPGLRSSMEALGLAFSLDPARLPALDKAFAHLDGFCQGLIDTRRANPHEADDADLLDILIDAADAGGVTRRQLVDLLIFLFVAGYDTSKNVLTYMMYLMTRHPEIYARCASDHDYCRKVVEEALRVYNPSSTFRITTRDIAYDGVMIPAETMVFFTLNVSGRDPGASEDADRFDPDRAVDPALRHVAFGLGKHMCLGQYIARAQLQEGIHAVAGRMRNPRLAGEPGWRPFPGVWGIDGLPLAFDAVLEPA